MIKPLSRRQMLATAAGSALVLSAGTISRAADQNPAPATAAPKPAANPFKYSLNTSTIRGQKLPIVEEVKIAAKAGYQGIEPWMGELETFKKNGGSLKDLGKQIADAGLVVPSSIGFAQWIVNDPAQRAKGLEQAKHDMEMVRTIGGNHMAAPPVGAHTQGGVELLAAAERYRTLLEIGVKEGVIPMVEVWGFSKVLHRVGDAYMVAVESDHPKACILPDIYHIFKGGSGFNTLRLLNGSHVPVFHVNDYPAKPPREGLNDAHRVFCGDGVAPMDEIFTTLRDIGMQGFLSLELFNPEYWKRDALEVATEGLVKTKAAVNKALKITA